LYANSTLIRSTSQHQEQELEEGEETEPEEPPETAATALSHEQHHHVMIEQGSHSSDDWTAVSATIVRTAAEAIHGNNNNDHDAGYISPSSRSTSPIDDVDTTAGLLLTPTSRDKNADTTSSHDDGGKTNNFDMQELERELKQVTSRGGETTTNSSQSTMCYTYDAYGWSRIKSIHVHDDFVFHNTTTITTGQL
jgi:hypothetical protein